MYTLLLVEDEPLLAFTETLMLEKQGYTVKHVLTGEDAVDVTLSDASIDLVLMDIDLGNGIDGTEASKLILAKKEVPIVFLTSHSEKDIIAKVKEITRYGLVIKNSGPFVLFSTIEMALDLFATKQEVSRLERRWNAALKATERGVWEYQASSNTVYISDQIKVLTGKMSNQSIMTLDEWLCWIYVDDRELVEFLLKTYLENQQSQFSVSFRLIHADGYPIWVKQKGNASERNEQGVVLQLIATITPLEEEYFQKEKLTKIAQHIPGVIYQYRVRKDGSSHFPYASEGIHDIYSVKPNEVVDDASPIFNVIHHDDIKEVARSVEESKVNLTKWRKRYRVKKNGFYNWVEGEATPELLSDGSVLWHGYIRLIDEPVSGTHSEMDLYTMLCNSFDDAPIPVFILNKQEEFTCINKAATALLGYSKQELTKQSIAKIAIDYNEHKLLFNQLLQGKSIHYVPQLRKKDGTSISVRLSAFQLDANHFVSFVLEVDQLIKATQKEQQQKWYYENILDSLPINVYRINRTGEVMYANKFYQENTGFDSFSIIGKTVYDLYPLEDADKYRRDDQKVFKTKEVFKTIERNVNPKTKKESFVQVIKQPFIEDGKVTGIVGIFYDITGTIEEDKAKDMLIQHQNTFSQQVHHRIKNNLAMIVGMMKLQADFSDNDAVKHSLLSATARVAVISTMYDKLYQSKNTEQLDLNEYMSSLMHDIQKTILPDYIQLTIKSASCMIPEKKALIVGICITELITNSIKYAFPRPKAGATIQVEAVLSESNVLITVSDNGIGFPVELRDKQEFGFGFTMIDSLTKQIHSTWKFDETNPNAIQLQITR